MNDPRTGASRTAYDPASGRVTAEVDPEGRTTRYAYYGPAHPAAGRLALAVMPDGKEQRVVSFGRIRGGRLIRSGPLSHACGYIFGDGGLGDEREE